MFDIDLQLLALVGQVVGQEDVALPGQFVDQLLAFRLGHIDADAALAAIGVAHHRVAVGVDLHAVQIDEAALRVAARGVLDLDDIRAPVGQNGAGHGNEGKLRDFKNAHALHDLNH